LEFNDGNDDDEQIEFIKVIFDKDLPAQPNYLQNCFRCKNDSEDIIQNIKCVQYNSIKVRILIHRQTKRIHDDNADDKSIKILIHDDIIALVYNPVLVVFVRLVNHAFGLGQELLKER
jgi:hypothetical protein